MKVKLLVIASLSVFSVHAQFSNNIEKNSKNSLIDLIYRPTQHVFYGKTSVNINKENYTVSSLTLGVDLSEITKENTTITQEVGFGITSLLSFGTSFEYFLSDDLKSSTKQTGGTDYTYKSKGLADPFIFTSYRLLEQTDGPLNLDIKLAISPSLTPAEQASSISDGNTARGGMQVTFDTFLGQQDASFSWMANVGIIFTDSREIEDGASGIIIDDIDSKFDFFARTGIQTSFLDDFYFSLEAKVKMVSTEKITLKSTGKTTKYEKYLEMGVTTQLEYMIFNDTLSAGVNFTFNKINDSDVVTSITTNTTTDRKENSLGVTIKYQF